MLDSGDFSVSPLDQGGTSPQLLCFRQTDPQKRGEGVPGLRFTELLLNESELKAL